MVYGHAASASPGIYFKMQIIWPYPRPTDSEILGVEPAVCVLQALHMLLGHPKFWEVPPSPGGLCQAPGIGLDNVD